jgi:hypothetical protein
MPSWRRQRLRAGGPRRCPAGGVGCRRGGTTQKREQRGPQDVLSFTGMPSIEALQARGGGRTHVVDLLKAELWRGMDAAPSPVVALASCL